MSDNAQYQKVLDGNKAKAEAILQDKKQTEELIDKVFRKLGEIPVLGSAPVVKQMVEDIPLLCHMVKDYIDGYYTEVPVGTIIAIIAGLIYVLSPVDLIPDPIPGVGYIDDAAVIGIVLTSLHSDIQDYKKWRDEQ